MSLLWAPKLAQGDTSKRVPFYFFSPLTWMTATRRVTMLHTPHDLHTSQHTAHINILFFLILHSIYSSYYISPYSSLYDRFTSFFFLQPSNNAAKNIKLHAVTNTHSTADRRMSSSRDISSFSFWLCGQEEKKEKEKHLLHVNARKEEEKKYARVVTTGRIALQKKINKKTKQNQETFFLFKKIFSFHPLRPSSQSKLRMAARK